jgi:hypothetical protein
VIDGVFARDGEGVGFHAAGRLTRDDVGETMTVAARRIGRLLERRGVTAVAEECG